MLHSSPDKAEFARCLFSIGQQRRSFQHRCSVRRAEAQEQVKESNAKEEPEAKAEEEKELSPMEALEKKVYACMSASECVCVCVGQGLWVGVDCSANCS